MKLYFLQRTELSDRVVGAFRAAEVGEDEAAGLIVSRAAIPYGDKRPIPRPVLIVDKERPQREKEINSIRRKACREAELLAKRNKLAMEKMIEFLEDKNGQLCQDF